VLYSVLALVNILIVRICTIRVISNSVFVGFMVSRHLPVTVFECVCVCVITTEVIKLVMRVVPPIP
jgi:hypothetical protein